MLSAELLFSASSLTIMPTNITLDMSHPNSQHRTKCCHERINIFNFMPFTFYDRPSYQERTEYARSNSIRIFDRKHVFHSNRSGFFPGYFISSNFNSIYVLKDQLSTECNVLTLAIITLQCIYLLSLLLLLIFYVICCSIVGKQY